MPAWTTRDLADGVVRGEVGDRLPSRSTRRL